MDITMTDFFCGAGGSSTGAVAAGVTVKMAANHWDRAIETHQTNHPTTDHDLSDLQQAHPSRYPRTTMAWFSPECTNHSIAKGKKRKGLGQLDLWGNLDIDPEEERSRATMREVVEFSEYHRYETVIVENVVDIRHWQHYDAWLTAMRNLGYDYKPLYLNSQFFGVPQSRDRIYMVFWKRGNRAPDLDFHPQALCESHGWIGAVQRWKKFPEWGRYGDRRQYVYCCPHCHAVVKPATVPASSVIDWAIPSPIIGERKRPLRDKTMERIKVGIQRFARPVVVDTAFTHADPNGKVLPADLPFPTQTTRQTLGVVDPFLLNYYSRQDAQSGLDRPIPTIPTENRHALVTPFVVEMYNTSIGRSVDDPLPCLLTNNHTGLLTPFIMAYFGSQPTYARVDVPMPTLTTVERHALINPDEVVDKCGFRMLTPEELKLGMSFPKEYVITGNNREQVKQVGNAVTCKVAHAIVDRCVKALA